MMPPAQRHALATLLWAVAVAPPARAELVQAATPPRGFNTFDGFGNGHYDEASVLNISRALRDNLLATGFEYMVLDGGWQRKNFTPEGKVPVLGPYGHPYPSADRFPSAGGPGDTAREGAGFLPLATRVHAMGLKFGVWVIKGVYKGAAEAKLPIKGTASTLDEIIDQSKGNGSCAWAGDWLGINASHPAAQAFYDSLVETLASWEVDFIKVDCIFGHGPHGLLPDIAMMAEAVRKVPRPIVLSLSPGGGIHPSDAAQVASPPPPSAGPLATMYRVTNDFHGGWYGYGGAQESAFIAGNLTAAGMQGLNGTFFDLDMLPINAGYWDPAKRNHGPPYDAPRGQSLLTLWTIARSPLFLTELPPFDDTTLAYLQNELAMRINARGRNARVVGYAGNCTCAPSHGVPGQCGIAGGKAHGLQLPACVATWAAEVDAAGGGAGAVAVALINLAENATQAPASVRFDSLGLDGGTPRKVTNVWTGKVLHDGVTGGFAVTLPGHGSLLAMVE